MNDILFTPQTLTNGVILKNRFVKPAMNEAMGTKHFQPKKEIVTLYKTWAEGGTGLIITGNVMVDSHYIAEPGNIVFDEHSDMNILRTWAQAGKINGAKIIVQMNHPGKQAPKTVSKEPLAPSAVPIDGELGSFFNTPRAMTHTEVKELVASFVRTAEIAYRAGFDGVEIHAAHGYLLNQFLSPWDNRREDEYGGNIENRMRVIVEIYEGIRAHTPADFIVGIKINSSDFKEGGFNEEDSLVVVERLAKAGIDFVEISGGSYEHPTMSAATGKRARGAFFAAYSKRVKEHVDVPVIVTGGIREEDSMRELIRDGFADCIGLARPLAIDPAIPNKIQEGTYQTLVTGHVSTGIATIDKKLGSMMGLVYYQLLMQSYAKGKIPHVGTNAWPALFHALRTQGAAALFPQRA